jgi:luciferase family oxidoreductase group 1
MRLGILDFSWFRPPALGLSATSELATRADTLGYSRYWIAEHHTGAHASPEVLIPLLAERTKYIRVGAAGILLRYYSAFKVAECFRLLATLFPSRIDLGIARGGAGKKQGEFLLEGRPEEDPGRFYQHVERLIGFVRAEGEIVPSPNPGGAPDVWVLGSGGTDSALFAGRAGASFSIALFLHPDADPSVIERYRAEFVPSADLPAPQCNVAVAGVCARTDTEARSIAAQFDGYGFVKPTVVGEPARCADLLSTFAERFDVEEIVFKDVCATPGEQGRCYELLADACKLNGR